MTLFTGKGDNGTTKTFGCNQRISKSSTVAWALGTLDECNSFVGLAKAKSKDVDYEVPGAGAKLAVVLHQVQENMFIVQAETAGADKKNSADKVTWAENIINEIEKTLPPISTFFIPGSTELGALLDICRTVSRRAERLLVEVSTEGVQPIGADTLAYMNRLSSLLYALARLTNHMSGITEEPPQYK
ncbi:MAG: cob(I)alamin adenosyltransferase [Patescibacteria group bacterium]|nr:cob(I)alamin adenosyltransferase [Patescibacteria group bacterium]